MEKYENEEYTNKNLIRREEFGDIYKVENKAIKIIDIEEILKWMDYENETYEEAYNSEIKRIKNGIENMKECSKNNEYSVKCYDYFQNDNRIGIIMEYCDDNLSHLLKRRKCGFNAKEIYEIMYQLNKTFKIMKENKIVHRDIKLEHILIKYENNNILNFICKLAGYDLSIKINDFIKLNEFAGTIITMAPEILELGEKEKKKNIQTNVIYGV